MERPITLIQIPQLVNGSGEDHKLRESESTYSVDRMEGEKHCSEEY